MMSFRTRLKKHANDDNGVRFYFANGYYMLSLGREGTGPRLSKLATAYDGNTATPLKEELNNPEFMLKPARWYTVEIGKFLGNIDVSINGAEVFNVFDNDPREGPGIGVGTSGTGKAYFDDIRI